jgi:hypothetical protein
MIALVEIRPGVIVNPIRLSITREGVEVLLTRQTFEMLSVIAKSEHGITLDGLFNCLYAHCADGGPLTGRKAVATQRFNLNSRLAPLGLHVRSNGSGRAGLYTLEVRHHG